LRRIHSRASTSPSNQEAEEVGGMSTKARKPKRKAADRPARFVAFRNKKGEWTVRVRCRGSGKLVGPGDSFEGSPVHVRRAFRNLTKAVDEARKHPILYVTRP
jgi:hypothetical protein